MTIQSIPRGGQVPATDSQAPVATPPGAGFLPPDGTAHDLRATSRANRDAGASSSPIVRRVFTFGFGHANAGRYVVVSAPTAEECREHMLQRYGNQWAFEYRDEDEAGVERWGLVELVGGE